MRRHEGGALMRILILNQYFHPDVSATSQLLTELCEDLAEHHEVFVVTGRPSYDPGEHAGSCGLVSKERFGLVKVARVWSTTFHRSNMVGRLTNYGTYLLSSVAGALSVPKPDVVVALTDPPPIGQIGSWVAAWRRAPFVLVVKDIFPEVPVHLGMLKNPILVRVLRRVTRGLLRSADRLVSIGPTMDLRLVEMGVPAERIAQIPDWADGTIVRPLDEPSPMREAQGWHDRFVVMHSGNVGLSQDLDVLLDAAALLREDEDIVIAIVGEGASKAALQERAGRESLTNVVFLPYQEKSSLSVSLGAADLHLVMLRDGLAGYIVPSKVYGILAAGKPYVTAVEAGAEPQTIAEEFECGMRVEPGDAEALAKAIRIMRHEADLKAMGVRARQALEQRYERQLSSRAYRQLLEGVSAR
jgi:colanic acid biosynthesis glycosyl transferase WcaI